VAVASGDHDGFGTGSELVCARSPAARPITLVAAGHVLLAPGPDRLDALLEFLSPGKS
jgi:hypothetical protein